MGRLLFHAMGADVNQARRPAEYVVFAAHPADFPSDELVNVVVVRAIAGAPAVRSKPRRFGAAFGKVGRCRLPTQPGKNGTPLNKCP